LTISGKFATKTYSSFVTSVNLEADVDLL